MNAPDDPPKCALGDDPDQRVDRNEEAVVQQKLPLLVAYRDQALSVEAAQQLVEMSEDRSFPAHGGKDLPSADRNALLKKVEELQKTR